MTDKSKDITIVDLLFNSTLDMDSMDLESINTTIASGAMNPLLRNKVTPGRTSTPKHSKSKMTTGRTYTPKGGNPEVSSLPKKKLKLSGVAARDKLMAMRDSDISSLNNESDS